MNKGIVILGLILGFFIFGVCGYLSYKNNALSAEVSNLKEALANREALIEVQNAQIQQNALDLDNYKLNVQASNTKILTKYENVYITDKSCKKELESIRSLIDTFYK